MLNVCAVLRCGICVWDGWRDYSGQATPDRELVSIRHWVVHMWVWSRPSLPVQLPPHCGAIMKTLGFRSHPLDYGQ